MNDRALEAIRDYRPEHNPEHNSSTGYKEEVNDAVDFIQKEVCLCVVMCKVCNISAHYPL